MPDFQIRWRRQRRAQAVPSLDRYPAPIAIVDPVTSWKELLTNRTSFNRKLQTPLDLLERPCYLEEDPNGTIQLSACRVDFTNLARDESAYVYRDMGVNHFDGDFIHRFTCEITSVTGVSSLASVWAVSNQIDNFTAQTDMIGLRFYENAGTPVFQLIEEDGGSSQLSANSSTISLGTQYWIETQRVDSTDTVTAKIYTDSSFTTQLGSTLTLNLTGTAVDFRYFYAAGSYNTGTASRTVTGFTAEHDLNVAPPPGAETYMPAWELATSNLSRFKRKIRTHQPLDNYRLKGITIDGFAEFYGTIHFGTVGVVVVPATNIPTAWISPKANKYSFKREQITVLEINSYPETPLLENISWLTGYVINYPSLSGELFTKPSIEGKLLNE